MSLLMTSCTNCGGIFGCPKPKGPGAAVCRNDCNCVKGFETAFFTWCKETAYFSSSHLYIKHELFDYILKRVLKDKQCLSVCFKQLHFAGTHQALCIIHYVFPTRQHPKIPQDKLGNVQYIATAWKEIGQKQGLLS